MDVYILDESRHIIGLCERYKSFIWTERYNMYGDFQLFIPSNSGILYHLIPGRYLYLFESNRLMIIESVGRNDKTADEDLVEVTGRSFEAFFKQRVACMNRNGTPHIDQGGAGGVVSRLVRDICVRGDGMSPLDVIPDLSVDEPSASSVQATYEIQIKPLYDAIKEICDSDDFGFRVSFDIDSRALAFRAYKGSDRSISGNTHPQVFGPEYDNLFNTTLLTSNEEFKNVAYVSHDDRTRIVIVYKSGYFEATSTDRRVLFVDANDIKEPTLSTLQQRGREALAEHNKHYLFDGEIRHSIESGYRSRYSLGDLVEFRNADGEIAKAKVLEHIWISDAEGIRSYPTIQAIEES